GSGLRVFNLQTLFIGTMMIGASIAFINVLLPSLVAANFPHKIGLYTTIYITLMGIAGTVASMVAVPIVSATSWKFFIYLITGVILLALLSLVTKCEEQSYVCYWQPIRENKFSMEK
ncbi:MAG: MFS transporter, partial [Streptococcus suis]